MSGVCVPDGSGSLCGQGTMLDPATNECVIDPNACAEGTVLVDGACVDEGVVTPDLEEGAEPNGLFVLGEGSVDPAGEIVVAAEGESFVAHGTIIPFQDSDGDGQDDADSDTYTLSVSEPTLLTVTIDGVHGLAGAFLSVAAVNDGPLVNWVRAGVNLTGDTSQRQLFLPAAGTYAIAITDTRSLFLGGAAGALEGSPALEYYATFTTTPIETEALTFTNGEAESTGSLAPGEVKFFTVAMDLGQAAALLDTPAADITGSLVITNVTSNQIKAVADEDDDTGIPAIASAIGFRTGDSTLVVADHVINTALQDVDYDLLVVTGGAVALSKTGATVTAPTDFNGSNVYFYDVTAANEIDGINIAFESPVVAQIVDENGNVFSNMTVDPTGTVPPRTMTDHAGFFRHPAPGRYYWITGVTGAVPADLDATSTITTVTPTAITKGTPTGNVNVNTTFESNIFSYDPVIATDAWQQFTASSTGAGGNDIVLRYFDPATAFGRLDDLAASNGGCSPFCDDVTPIFETSHAANGSDTVGRILLDDKAATYLVTANTPAPTGTINLTFARRAHVDIGTKNADDTDNRANQALNAGTQVQRYLVRTQRDNEVELTVDPTTLVDVRIQQVNNDESARGAPINGGIAGVDETATLYQRGDGWTAWTVTPVIVPATNESFEQDLTILPAFYTVADTATAFSDACAGGGSVVATGNSDDGVTGTISSPASFDLFGVASPNIRASTNGLINFANNTGSFATHADMPSTAAPNAVIAPFWTDLFQVQICTKTAGTKLTIQWTGLTFDGETPVQFQVILDGSNDSIEFVYGPDHLATGAIEGADVGATIGVENQAGTKSKVIGFDAAAVTASSSQKFTVTP